jgi:hypothetical protein
VLTRDAIDFSAHDDAIPSKFCPGNSAVLEICIHDPVQPSRQLWIIEVDLFDYFIVVVIVPMVVVVVVVLVPLLVFTSVIAMVTVTVPTISFHTDRFIGKISAWSFLPSLRVHCTRKSVTSRSRGGVVPTLATMWFICLETLPSPSLLHFDGSQFRHRLRDVTDGLETVTPVGHEFVTLV